MERLGRIGRTIAGAALALGLIMGMAAPAGAVPGAGIVDGPDEVVTAPWPYTFSYPQIQLFGTVDVPGGNPFTGWMTVTGMGGQAFVNECSPFGPNPLCAPGASTVLIPYGGYLTTAGTLSGSNGFGNFINGTCGARPNDIASWEGLTFTCTATTDSGGNGTFIVNARVDHAGGYLSGTFTTDSPA
jgi:hypothetical protein